MPWKLRLIDPALLQNANAKPLPGDCWFSEAMKNHHSLSPQYLATWSDTRLPIVICLPSGEKWCPDLCAADPQGERGPGYGWVITGIFPKISAHPSVKALQYHGTLKDGVLSDDLEGRKFYGT